MDWYLHKQAIGRLGPLLMVASLFWLLAAYFYFDPLAALGITRASKASWGALPNAALLRAAVTTSISSSGPALGMYFVLYWRARRGERIAPAPWPMYLLTVGGIIAGASVYVFLRYLPSA